MRNHELYSLFVSGVWTTLCFLYLYVPSQGHGGMLASNRGVARRREGLQHVSTTSKRLALASTRYSGLLP